MVKRKKGNTQKSRGSGGSSSASVLKNSLVAVVLGIALYWYRDGLLSSGHHEVHVMSMDPIRFEKFQDQNKHLLPHLHRWEAVDGRRISEKDAVQAGILTEELAFHPLTTPGTTGVTMSHLRIWRHVAASDKAVLVLEDDAITHKDILQYGERHASELAQADITLCGHNRDAITLSTDKRGTSEVSLVSPHFPTPQFINNALSLTEVESVERNKLRVAFGLCCYWISPKGARKLLKEVLPLSMNRIFGMNPNNPDDWPPPNHALLKHYKAYQKMAQFSLDARLSAKYDTLDAYITFPSLAYTPNVDSSTKEVYSGHRAKANFTLTEIRTMLAGGGEKPASLV